MGRILDRFFNRNGNEEEDKAILSATAVNVATAINTGPSANDAEARKEEGINKDMINDPKLDAMVESLISVEVKRTIWVQDKLADGTINYKPETVTEPMFNPWAAALRFYISSTNATRYKKAYDAEIDKMRIDRDFLKMKRSMPKRQRQTFNSMLTAANWWCRNQENDAIDGRKGLLLKVTQKKLEVGLNRGVGK
jgi:hypothetical protein